jgi:integrase
LNFKNGDGKRKQKWIALDIEVKNNKRKAEQALNKLISEYEKSKIIVTDKQRFTVFYENWLKTMKNSVKPTTYDNYCIIYNRHIKPYFNERSINLDSLTPMQLQEYYNSLLEKGLSANTVHKHHANIHKALDYAMKMNIIAYNPADRVTIPKSKRYTGNFYTEEQLKQVIQTFKGNEIESCVFLTANYGFRRSEVLGLKWDAVDFENNTICVHHTAVAKKGGTLYDDTTKNKSSMRTLPLTESVRKYLLDLKAHQQEMKELFGSCYNDNDYICKFDDGHMFRPDYVSHKFKVGLERSDLPVIRFHDLRHSSASLLIKAGFNLKEVQEWLGHADISTTGNIYAHLQFSSKVSMAEKINSALENP